MRRLGPALTLLLSMASAASTARAVDASSPARAAATPSATLSPAGEGRRLYLKLNCYGCHGMRAEGGMAPRLEPGETGDLQEAVTRGEEDGMPSFVKYVSKTDIANLAAYLRSLGGRGEPVFVEWWNAVPSR